MPPQLVTIEGNVGAGKTTIASHVSKFIPDCKFFQAPSRESNPHWKAFQANPKDHVLDMQCWFLKERLRVYTDALEHMELQKESVILDFSVWSDIVFATHHHQRGVMSREAYEAYMALWRSIEALSLPPPHLTILLHANPTICLERCEASESLKTPRSRTQRWSKMEPAEATSFLEDIGSLLRQRWLRDVETVFTPKWLTGERVPPDAEGLPAAPSKLVLVRDWSDLSRVSGKVLADAVMCTDPCDFEAWLSPYKAKAGRDRVTGLLQTMPRSPVVLA